MDEADLAASEAVSETVEIHAPAEAVFAHIDAIHNVGSHMTERSSMAMMGSKLKLEVVSAQPSGLGATYRYSGKMMGLSLDFSESVTKYVPNREKVWRTIGLPRLLIMSSYEMRVVVEAPSRSRSRLTVSIAFELPRPWFWRLVGLLLSGWYSRWCLRRICQDAKRALEMPRAALTGGAS